MKYLKYLNYIIKHKWFVLIECFKVGLYWRGIIHDISKLLPSEFFPYANYFYGKSDKWEGSETEYKPYGYFIEEKFNIAWLKHIHRNPHHWQYWILREDDGNTIIMDMPLKYRIEMLCDWRGAGKAITGKDNTLEWYEKNNAKILLRTDTRKWIENQLTKKNN